MWWDIIKSKWVDNLSEKKVKILEHKPSFEVDVPKMVYFCKEDPEMIRMTSDFGWEMDRPTEMRDVDPRSIGVQEDMFICLEVENSEKWIHGFKEHGTSEKINGFSEDLLMSRTDLCDESRTRIFKHAWKPNWVAVLMYEKRLQRGCALHLSMQPCTLAQVSHA